MTRYTVLWDEDVEKPFIEFWLAGDSALRAKLTEIANWIDSNLAETPDRQGIYWPDEDARIAEVPLASSAARVSVTFEVVPQDRLVRIVRLTLRF